MRQRSHDLATAHVALILGGLALVAACEAPFTDVLGPEAEASQQAASVTDYDLFFEDVELHPGASADLHVRVFVNEARPCHDPKRTAFFIHGVNATAASWGRFAEAFFQGSAEDQLCRIAAIDHPGHGASGLPEGVLFGELVIQDYARAAMEVLDRLHRRGIRPSILVGHSQGTSTTQAIQRMLTDARTNLADRFGIRDVVFLGTQGPRELRAEFLLPAPEVQALISSLVTTTPEKGTYVQGPPSLFRQLWFINLSLELSASAPSVSVIAENGWSADVPLFATLQAAGLGGFDTPSVDAGAFAPSSDFTLHFIDFADDPWSLTPRAKDIYEYLTGDATLDGFVSLTDANNDAIHDFMITHPGVVRNAIDLPRNTRERAAGG